MKGHHVFGGAACSGDWPCQGLGLRYRIYTLFGRKFWKVSNQRVRGLGRFTGFYNPAKNFIKKPKNEDFQK